MENSGWLGFSAMITSQGSFVFASENPWCTWARPVRQKGISRSRDTGKATDSKWLFTRQTPSIRTRHEGPIHGGAYPDGTMSWAEYRRCDGLQSGIGCAVIRSGHQVRSATGTGVRCAWRRRRLRKLRRRDQQHCRTTPGLIVVEARCPLLIHAMGFLTQENARFKEPDPKVLGEIL